MPEEQNLNRRDDEPSTAELILVAGGTACFLMPAFVLRQFVLEDFSTLQDIQQGSVNKEDDVSALTKTPVNEQLFFTETLAAASYALGGFICLAALGRMIGQRIRPH